MKRHFTFILLLVAGCFATVKAELVWKAGYVILNSGDTLKGEVKYNTKKELGLFSKVPFRQGEVVKTYKPDQIKEFSYEETRFLSRTLDKEFVFMKVISSGALNLFEMQFEVYHGDKTLIESEYYIEKNDGKANDLQKLKSGKFKKTVSELMADNSELVARVEASDKKYEIGEIQSVVEEYNTWFSEQNGGAKGTR